MKQIDNAIKLAAHWHDGQYRKYNINGVALPYLVHPVEVAKLLWRWGVGDQTVLSAAVLHDLLEDTKVTDEEILEIGGKEILALVRELTFKHPLDITPEERAKLKADYIASFRWKDTRSLLIKVSDRICNTWDKQEFDIARARRYYGKAFALRQFLEERRVEIESTYGEKVFTNITLDWDGTGITLDHLLEGKKCEK